MTRSSPTVPVPALNETPQFFRSGENRLFGVLHQPDRAVARHHGFVLCYPCFEEKLWVHRVYVSLARDLAALGYHVLRFDYMGHGDSDGEFQQATVTTRLFDIASAVNFLREESGAGVSLLGLRLGALLAALHAERDTGIESLVLWEPVTNGSAYMQEVLLSNLATQSAIYQEIRQTREDLAKQMQSGETVTIEGYELTRAFFEETSALNSHQLGKYAGPCLVAQTGRANQKPKKPLEALAQGYAHAELVMVVEEPFWKEIKTYYPSARQLSGVTLDWIQKHVG